MNVKFWENSSDDQIIRELLPFVAPHEGVLRCQLQREDNPLLEREELRWVFSFTCNKCDHQTSRGYEVLLDRRSPQYLQPILDQVAQELRVFCGDTRDAPCLATEEMAWFAEKVTELLTLYRTVSSEEFGVIWSVMFAGKSVKNARAVAKHLGFEVMDGMAYELPSAHPWKKAD